MSYSIAALGLSPPFRNPHAAMRRLGGEPQPLSSNGLTPGSMRGGGAAALRCEQERPQLPHRLEAQCKVPKGACRTQWGHVGFNLDSVEVYEVTPYSETGSDAAP
mmetsp:Transcript_23018/g.54553  ORF Transcript_23018/g.54553 Transcript_23018/m.54553 type:complete len:105 (-) Transcript_23018:289-603(-)